MVRDSSRKKSTISKVEASKVEAVVWVAIEVIDNLGAAPNRPNSVFVSSSTFTIFIFGFACATSIATLLSSILRDSLKSKSIVDSVWGEPTIV